MGNERLDRRGIKFVVVNDSHSPRFCVKERKQQQRDYLKISYLTFPDCALPGKKKKREGGGKSRIVISTMDVYHGRWTN